MKCFSWNTDLHMLSYVILYLNKDKIKRTPQKDHEYYFYIYVTYDGQLIRNMMYIHKEDFWLISNKSYNQIRFDMSGFSLLRLRTDSKSACNFQTRK